MATVDQVITKAFTHAVRKPVPPAPGTTKYNALVIIVDSVQKDWAAEPDIDWDSLYSKETVGTASSTDTYDLDDSIDYIIQDEQDPILVGSTEFKLVRPKQLYKYRDGNVCAKIGNTLKFARTLSGFVGQSIIAPCILKVDDLTQGTDEIQIDDFMYASYMTAAEFDRNDIVKAAQYDNIIQLAEQHMQKMKNKNEGSLEEVETPWAPSGADWDVSPGSEW